MNQPWVNVSGVSGADNDDINCPLSSEIVAAGAGVVLLSATPAAPGIPDSNIPPCILNH